MLELELQKLGFCSWVDTKAKSITRDGMATGIAQAGCFVLFLSRGVLTRPYCQFEGKRSVAFPE